KSPPGRKKHRILCRRVPRRVLRTQEYPERGGVAESRHKGRQRLGQELPKLWLRLLSHVAARDRLTLPSSRTESSGLYHRARGPVSPSRYLSRQENTLRYTPLQPRSGRSPWLVKETASRAAERALQEFLERRDGPYWPR